MNELQIYCSLTYTECTAMLDPVGGSRAPTLLIFKFEEERHARNSCENRLLDEVLESCMIFCIDYPRRQTQYDLSTALTFTPFKVVRLPHFIRGFNVVFSHLSLLVVRV